MKKTQKLRRRSGYVTPRATVSKKDLLKNDLFINPFYDEWKNHRDGFRDWFGDFKKIKKLHRRHWIFNDELYEKRNQMNSKQEKLLKRRKVRKNRRI